MKAVINSSPLISLALVEQLELLPKLYSELIIPKSVYNEVMIKGKGKTGGKELDIFKRFTVLDVQNKIAKDTIMLELDEGEAEVIE